MQNVIDLSSLAWADAGICSQVDPEAFYPDKGASTAGAKRTCLSCPVILQCLEYALDHNEEHGIWGGLGTKARGKLKRDRARAAKPLSRPTPTSLLRLVPASRCA